MDSYYILSSRGERIKTKLELVGYTPTILTSGIGYLERCKVMTLIVEDNDMNAEVLDRIKSVNHYKDCLSFDGHVVFTNDAFIAHLLKIGFKQKEIQYYDNFPEAKLDLAKCYMPVVIRPYGVSDLRHNYLIREYSKGIDAIYDCLESSPCRHVIIEQYL